MKIKYVVKIMDIEQICHNLLQYEQIENNRGHKQDGAIAIVDN